MRVGVIGGGLMGSGIAEVCARSGVDVTVVEVDDERAERARAAIEQVARPRRALGQARRGRTAQRAARAPRRTPPTLEDLEGADAAIEAIIEDEPPSASCSARLDEILPDARVPRLQHLLGADHEARRRAPRSPTACSGMHFFNPVPVLPLVEIVRSIMTGRRDRRRARASSPRSTLGKTCIDSQDRAGFVVNALLIPYLLSAIRMYESGFAVQGGHRPAAWCSGCAHPMGPLALRT